MPTYPYAYTKIKKSIYDIQFPGKWSEFDTIKMIFAALQSEFTNPKITGIQPYHEIINHTLYIHKSGRFKLGLSLTDSI